MYLKILHIHVCTSTIRIMHLAKAGLLAFVHISVLEKGIGKKFCYTADSIKNGLRQALSFPLWKDDSS